MLTLIMLRKQIEEMPPIMREIPMQQSRNLQNRDMATWIWMEFKQMMNH